MLKATLVKQNRLFTLIVSLLAVISSSLPLTVTATDIVRINKRNIDIDTRTIYTHEVLEKALQLSSDKYGDYEIATSKHVLPNHRTLDFLEKGELLNLVMVVTNNEWERRATPIRIPIRLGALAFRLIATNEEAVSKFESVEDINHLKKLHVGLLRHWSTWDLMTQLNFTVTTTYQYENLFNMLAKNRVDYVPRGFYEIYDEMEPRRTKLPNLKIEPSLALYMPAPYYIFVSPKAPRLAERLTYGLEKMVASGTLKKCSLIFTGKLWSVPI